MIEGWADILSVIASIFICLGVIGGAIWKYRTYLRERQKFPKATLSQTVVAIRLTDDKVCIHTSVTILNIGKVMLALSSATHNIYQVQPIDNRLLERLKDTEEVYDAQNKEIQWPVLDNKQIDVSKQPWEIEIGENDTIDFDSIIPSCVETINVYTYFANSVKPDLGWPISGLYKVAEII